ncbi:MAG TPA: hypothetical protein VNR39_12000 [Pseudolabrys sp.]|nr:hypothetical protein [Pseudolabrys sp.]
MIAAFIAAAGLPFATFAQTRCAEGRTTGGQCVDEQLAASTRQTAIIFSQSKISHTAFPVLPSQDARYRYPNELIPNPLPPAGTGTPAAN